MLNVIKGGLVVSCQALEHEPLHSSFIMAKMALAAKEGGAAGIRANSKRDIIAIKQEVALPVIGIVKRDYEGSEVFITATKIEIDELLESGCDMIAMDATMRARPNGETLLELVNYCRSQNPAIELMGDVSTLSEAVLAQQLGFDCVSTTLYGYTRETALNKLYHNDFDFLKLVLKELRIPVIAEGNVLTPEMFKRCLELGATSVVVGGAITRPRDITARFTEALSRIK
ncbi:MULTISPECIES: N-acetylmannosamine-6-phosphate 2-epimerase [unclassified Paenibacillus]|uniref:N-acetylmannosamine-6-phosphate 2-epimerase n=1 Tax=unclassified Paenibacillus TaxID=185978 RepID=UPI002F41CDD5